MIVASCALQNNPPSSDLSAEAATSLSITTAAWRHLFNCSGALSFCFQPKKNSHRNWFWLGLRWGTTHHCALWAECHSPCIGWWQKGECLHNRGLVWPIFLSTMSVLPASVIWNWGLLTKCYQLLGHNITTTPHYFWRDSCGFRWVWGRYHWALNFGTVGQALGIWLDVVHPGVFWKRVESDGALWGYIPGYMWCMCAWHNTMLTVDHSML